MSHHQLEHCPYALLGLLLLKFLLFTSWNLFSDSYLISSESSLKILINFTSTVLRITFLALLSNLKNQNKFTFPRLAIKSFQSFITFFCFSFFNIAFKTFETLYVFYFFQNNLLYFRSKNLDEFRPYLLVLIIVILS